ncbi:N-6 DNA methylase [Duganella sp. FT134W]|uniref:site-specific DNA-methyltransferase (adenine-specific) n=1 Tax=Duganella margarita TaxID=2692170 RepID=A0A7X4GY48_9BURK|nr:N-6 DNA methylase [Duganella margarita]MYM71763.1 N-6 DNA methylase [Duganella margarita]
MSSMLGKETELGPIPEFGVNSHDIDNRKKLGAFYTPLVVSTVLSNWGIRTPRDKVLEPCFGGCTFLDSAVARLGSIGSKNAQTNLFGCDIDPVAFTVLNRLIKPSTLSGHFFQQDFLELEPDQCATGKMDLVIGNPPYIRHSNFSTKQKANVAKMVEKSAVRLHGRANLWAYFVVHALKFLNPNGRLALVLPGSFLYADYSAAIRTHIRSSFERVVAYTLAERLFLTEGTEETTVVLLAEGFGQQPDNNELVVRCVDSTDELTRLINTWPADIETTDRAHPGHGLVPYDIGKLHDTLATLPNMRSLKDVAQVRIGLVTGDTPYFVKNASEWKVLQIDRRHLAYIMPRSHYVRGITINVEDCDSHIAEDIRCLALWTPTKPRAERLLAYLASYPESKREANSTFRRRPVWHQFADVHGTPDAFFVFMADQGPRLILNRAQVNATNSMYRVFFENNVRTIEQKLIAVSMHTTYSQLSAEIIGHPRGSGALKLEPSSVLKLSLYLPPDRASSDINAAFELVNDALRRGDALGARKCADKFLFSRGKLAEALPVLRKGLDLIRSRRIR